jgi:hypothetical protein
MSRFLKTAGIVAVLVAVVALVGATAAFAQGPNRPEGVTTPGAGQARNGFGDGQGLMAVDEADMHAAIAGVLGLEVGELEAELAAGKTLAVLAAELDVDFVEVQAAMGEVHANALQEAVQSGVITQEQANWRLSHGGGPNGQAGGLGNGAGGRMGRGNGGNGGFGGNGGDCPYATS